MMCQRFLYNRHGFQQEKDLMGNRTMTNRRRYGKKNGELGPGADTNEDIREVLVRQLVGLALTKPTWCPAWREATVLC
ncbi:hypothetical protein RRG08_000080 [Elysia crispata]|uniref:Uncharacterized protein n=1 Tax=Elysia crispata TaxID=231223 RepID=A0AAE1DQZ1_9GAST|nr:hypothetical protein RRG08_000080 [Elysia crispata]